MYADRPSDTLATVDRTRATGIALVVVSAIAFGSGGLFAKPVYATGVDWMTLMAWRFALGGAVAWLVLAFRPSALRALRALPRRTVLGAIGLGVFYVTNTATYYAGLETVPLGLSALIVYLYPPIVAVLALRLGRPLEGRRAWGALGIAVLGVALAVGGIPAGADIPPQGLLLILLSPVFYSLELVPPSLRPWMLLNPLTPIVQHARDTLLWGVIPNWWSLGLVLVFSIIVLQLGYVWFMKTRRGFADVL